MKLLISLTSVCALFVVTTANAAFVGDYDVSNWTSFTDNNGSVNLSGAPETVTINGADLGPCPLDCIFVSTNTDFTISVVSSDSLIFHWSYWTEDYSSADDPFGYLLNGTFTQLSFDDPFTGDTFSNGILNIDVLAGDVFGFRINSPDSRFGQSHATISMVPVPAAVWLFGTGFIALIGIARRKKA